MSLASPSSEISSGLLFLLCPSKVRTVSGPSTEYNTIIAYGIDSPYRQDLMTILSIDCIEKATNEAFNAIMSSANGHPAKIAVSLLMTCRLVMIDRDETACSNGSIANGNITDCRIFNIRYAVEMLAALRTNIDINNAGMSANALIKSIRVQDVLTFAL